MYKLVIGKRLE